MNRSKKIATAIVIATLSTGTKVSADPSLFLKCIDDRHAPTFFHVGFSDSMQRAELIRFGTDGLNAEMSSLNVKIRESDNWYEWSTDTGSRFNPKISYRLNRTSLNLTADWDGLRRSMSCKKEITGDNFQKAKQRYLQILQENDQKKQKTLGERKI